MIVECICRAATKAQLKIANELCGEQLNKTSTDTYELIKMFNTKREAQQWMGGRAYELSDGNKDLRDEMLKDVFMYNLLRYKGIVIVLRRKYL